MCDELGSEVQLVADFLQREAKRDLEAASGRFAADLGLKIRRVSVRDQSSRWGSCSSTGAPSSVVAGSSVRSADEAWSSG